MRATKLIQVLKETIHEDLTSPKSAISFFLANNMSGGWEAWLQTRYARAIFAVPNGNILNFNREVYYPNTRLRCDLWLQGGTGIWIELKTQRNVQYGKAVLDFEDDINKILSLDSTFKRQNVLVAAVVLQLSVHGVRPPVDDRTLLETLRNRIRGGSLNYALNTGNGWADVTGTILRTPLGSLVCATFTL